LECRDADSSGGVASAVNLWGLVNSFIVRCKTCHYSLEGLTGPPHRCPECGRKFDPTDVNTFETNASQRAAAVRRALITLALIYGIMVVILVSFVRFDRRLDPLGQAMLLATYPTFLFVPFILLQMILNIRKYR
jgi:hypothetical protein